MDFALGSDSHVYSRTYELYKDKKVTGGQGGTVYVTSPQTEGGSLSSISNSGATGRCEFYGDVCVGACYFVVNSNSITLYTIGSNGKIYDKKTVGRKKRN